MRLDVSRRLRFPARARARAIPLHSSAVFRASLSRRRAVISRQLSFSQPLLHRPLQNGSGHSVCRVRLTMLLLLLRAARMPGTTKALMAENFFKESAAPRHSPLSHLTAEGGRARHGLLSLCLELNNARGFTGDLLQLSALIKSFLIQCPRLLDAVVLCKV